MSSRSWLPHPQSSLTMKAAWTPVRACTASWPHHPGPPSPRTALWPGSLSSFAAPVPESHITMATLNTHLPGASRPQSLPKHLWLQTLPLGSCLSCQLKGEGQSPRLCDTWVRRRGPGMTPPMHHMDPTGCWPGHIRALRPPVHSAPHPGT